jgi:hypothetical protein
MKMDPKYALLYDTILESLFTGTRCLCRVTTNLPSTISRSAQAQRMLDATMIKKQSVFTPKDGEDKDDVTENDDIFVTEVVRFSWSQSKVTHTE